MMCAINQAQPKVNVISRGVTINIKELRFGWLVGWLERQFNHSYASILVPKMSPRQPMFCRVPEMTCVVIRNV